MQDETKKEDLRVVKSKRALVSAMFTLLAKRNFEKASVKELCDQALISRSVFYAYFNDKYDLLRYWLAEIARSIPDDVSAYRISDIVAAINAFILEHKKVIKNIVEYANETTMGLLQEFMELSINKLFEHKTDPSADASYSVLQKFCAGGLINLLKWYINYNFPADIQLMNVDLYNILRCIVACDTEKGKKLFKRADCRDSIK